MHVKHVPLSLICGSGRFLFSPCVHPPEIYRNKLGRLPFRLAGCLLAIFFYTIPSINLHTYISLSFPRPPRPFSPRAEAPRRRRQRQARPDGAVGDHQHGHHPLLGRRRAVVLMRLGHPLQGQEHATAQQEEGPGEGQPGELYGYMLVGVSVARQPWDGGCRPTRQDWGSSVTPPPRSPGGGRGAAANGQQGCTPKLWPLCFFKCGCVLCRCVGCWV